ncbi:ExbD/TolR family protein [Peredibacter starrii]|uniref:Biopolymer transporter ExbD n=1 Tax=Peredibacter starrii TaxID=28202 RepID=A0AAX4HU63_9BACT|nr:biopolymer transporter ExbD [Peredibacter starrii]WPU66904.1 biopolymer transporter ExbD [Peredibacter starrii]
MAFSNKNGNDEEQIVSDINMTPLIDIMLVLLIIFMVSSSAAIESGLDVDLPEMNAVSDKNGETLVVSLSKNGGIAVQGEEVKLEELQERIKAKLVSLKTESVILEGDAESQLDKVMTIMDTARSAGAKNFSIAARLKTAQ